ncbi:MAG: hypothetical protein M0R76_12400 [Proteobacteria bacterium]|nr:hypothetical protein [Pseudomonadota bacterium]
MKTPQGAPRQRGILHGIWMHKKPARGTTATRDVSRYKKPVWAQFDAREKTGAHDVAQVNPLKSLHIILGF